MSRSYNDHSKNYYMIIGSRNFKNQTKQRVRAIGKQMIHDIEKDVENAEVAIAHHEAQATIKKDAWWYD